MVQLQHGARIGLCHTGHRHRHQRLRLHRGTIIHSRHRHAQHAGIDGTTIGILAIPGQAVRPGIQVVHLLAVDNLAPFVGQIDPNIAGLGVQLEAQTRLTRFRPLELEALTRRQHLLADHVDRRQRRVLRRTGREVRHRLVQRLDTPNRTDLRQLRGHLGILHRVHRILVAHLRHQQLQEAILRPVGSTFVILVDVGVGHPVHQTCRCLHAPAVGIIGRPEILRLVLTLGRRGPAHHTGQTLQHPTHPCSDILGSLTDRQRLECKLLGRVHHLDVVLIGT